MTIEGGKEEKRLSVNTWDSHVEWGGDSGGGDEDKGGKWGTVVSTMC